MGQCCFSFLFVSVLYSQLSGHTHTHRVVQGCSILKVVVFPESLGYVLPSLSFLQLSHGPLGLGHSLLWGCLVHIGF